MGSTDPSTDDSESEVPAVTKRGFMAGTSALLGTGLVSGRADAVTERLLESKQPSPSTARSSDGMVASSHQRATEIGVSVLEEGGNAIDAAVAVQFALNVVQPHTSGIGGGGFMLVYVADRDEVYAIDNRERAPLGANEDMFLNEQGEEVEFQDRRTNGKSVGVPGTLRACEVALKRFGSMELGPLVAPAISLASEGVSVDAFLAEAIGENVGLDAFNDAAGAVFAPDGEPLSEGDTLVQEDLADTLARIREAGSDPFYKGEIAKDIAETVQGLARRRKRGGNMSPQDLGRYNVDLTLPTVGRYEGAAHEVTVRTMSSPSSGGLTISQILALLEPFDLASFDRRSVDTYHLIAEASNLAFVDRIAHLGDDEFVDIPTQGFLDEEYVEQRRGLISADSARDSYEPGDPYANQPGGDYRVAARDVQRFKNLADASGNESNGSDGENSGQTTHFTTADADGNMVSWTSTIEQLFGSGNMVPGRGFMLNNELTDFDSEPGGPNEVQPEKAPLSSTSPTIVFRDDEPFFTVGSPGGFTIITTVSQIVLNVAEFGMSLEEAVAEPRLFAFGDGRLFAERTVPADVREALGERGHEMVELDAIGNVQAISVEDGTYVGVGDFRRNSAAGGL